MHNRVLLTFLLLSIFVAGWGVPATQAQEDDLLEPDRAFRVSGKAVAGGDEVVVQWDIAEGYYLYRTKFKFYTDTLGIELGTPDFPPAELKHDEFFGDMEIYRNRVAIRLPIKRDPGSENLLALRTSSQGCADQGICYPPHSQNILLALAQQPPAPQAGESRRSQGRQLSALEALANLGDNLGLSGDDDLLPPDQAFRFHASVEDASHLRLQWQVAPGYYMYRDKIKLGLKDVEGVALGAVNLPPGESKEDEFFGSVQVYHGDVDVLVPLRRSLTEASDIVLRASYQGCAERGVCYPPINKETSLSLPPLIATAAAQPVAIPDAGEPPAPEEPIAEHDRIAATMATGNIWWIIASFFGFGLLLAFTPCIFPMIPILSGIIAGHGKNITPRKAFMLSLVYVLAMSVTYTAAGVLAGLFGGNLQAAFQNPWILSSFAAVFVLLALSMFGFYDLQLPSGLQSKLTQISNRQQGGHFAGVAIMGFLSALIVGPCVAPPLAAALIHIGQTGDAALGGLALFALSMGMGMPLIAIGTSAGKLLPKAGPWMDAIKAVFGVGLLAVAIVMLERIVLEEIAMLLWGTLLIVSAIYMGAFGLLPEGASGWRKLWKGLGVVLLGYGSLMLIGVAAGGKDTLQPLRGLGFASNATEQRHLDFKRIKTLTDLEREVAAASTRNQPVMLDFYADWCVTCKEMEKYTFSDPKVIKALQDFVLLQADVTANDAQDQALLQGHFGLPGPPSIMLYGADGRERKNYRVIGYMGAEEFAEHVRKAVQ